MDALLSLILSNGWIAVIGAAVIAVIGAWMKGRSTGRQAERDKQARATEKARKVGAEADSDAQARPIDETRGRLRKWTRD